MPQSHLAYGQRPVPTKGRAGRRTDDRYHTARWRKLSAHVLKRDGYRCRIVVGCDVRATVADHVDPVYAGMPDAAFYDEARLRAGCGPHNLWRGLVARQEAREGRSLGQGQSARLRRDHLSPRTSVVTGDYTRATE